MNSTIITDLAFIIPDATPYHFGVLTSRMHNAWMRAVCGRLKSDHRYSKDIVYNNFIWPGCGGGAQMEVWREIVARNGVAVADALNRHLFRRYLELEFPGRPMAAKFTLSNEKKPTAGEIADLAVKIKSAGYTVDQAQLEEKTGLKLVKDETPAPQPGMGAPFMNKVGRRKEKVRTPHFLLPPSSLLLLLRLFSKPSRRTRGLRQRRLKRF